MECKVSDLVKRGHLLASEVSDTSIEMLRSSIASMISDLATQLDVQLARSNALAAENAGLKAKGRELLGEACAVYAKFNKLIDPEIGDFIDGQTLHEFQYVLDCETPATDAFLAEVRAQGVEMFADSLLCPELDDTIREFAAQLRKGVQS